MRVKYSIHRKASMVGKVEDVADDWGERLIAAGQAVEVAGTASALASPADVLVAGQSAELAQSAAPVSPPAGRRPGGRRGDAGAAGSSAPAE